MVYNERRARVAGPLAVHEEGFRAALVGAGYRPSSVRHLVLVTADLSRWLEAEQLGARDLTPNVVSEFVNVRRAAGYRRVRSPRALRPLLDYLHGLRATPEEGAAVGSVEELVGRFRVYLATERGLAPRSVDMYVISVRAFVERFFTTGAGQRLGDLGAAEVTDFVVERSRRPGGNVKRLISALRSLLRFLVVDGVLARDLSVAVPAVASWRGQALPRGLSSEHVVALLASCDVSRAVGRRDQAILTLLTRLGLRACEVARLRLEDFDWRHGELTVRGKGRRDERLPIPSDVGETVVAYLRGDNNRGEAREVFLKVVAPVAPMTAEAVRDVVRHAGVRAGLGGIGAHRLRHTAATEMLRAGTPLVEVGQVLRHRTTATTAIYAKVDRIALRALVQPWPEVTA